MSTLEEAPRKSGSRKLQKRIRPNRMPSSKMPARLKLGDDAQDDVTAPDRGGPGAAQYMNMNQSIFSMIAAAGSRTDFNTRFDDSSDSEDDIPEEREEVDDLHEKGDSALAAAVKSQSPTTGSESTALKKKKRLSDSKLMQPLRSLSLKSRKQRKPSQQSPSPPSDDTSKSVKSNPRDAPVMSRLLTAEAELEETVADELADTGRQPTRDRADSSPATLLASRLMDIFGLDSPETVVAEYQAWLLQSVLLQGYLYITRYHICFFAYLPKKSNTVAKNGYLSKRGKSTVKYNRYWFILKGDVLSYYTDPSAQYFPQGNIDLRYGISASVSADKDKQKDCRDFSITTDHRTYHFRADSAESAKEWVKSLQKTIFRSHNDGDSVKISLPIENVIDIEESPVVQLAHTIKVRVVENDDSYAIDEYFFSFFNNGPDVLNVLANIVPGSSTPAMQDQAWLPEERRARSPGARKSLDMLGGSPRERSITPLREGVRATLKPFAVGDDGRMSPRMSGEFTRPSKSPGRASLDAGTREYGRASFDRGRRPPSTSRLEVATEKRSGRSPLAHEHESPDSPSHSYDNATDSSVPPLSPKAEAQMSASQILTRSDVFHPPKVQKMDTLNSVSSGPTRHSSEIETAQSSSPRQSSTPPVPIRSRPGPRERVMSQDSDYFEARKEGSRDTSSPTLQDLYKGAQYPLQRAGAFAGYLKNKSNRMSKLLAAESMSYLEKVSGMWAGNRKHYGADEAVVSDDRAVDQEDLDNNVAFGDRFRMHFALPPTEKLQATYFCFLHRVLPLYGKVYISNRKFCFRSMLPGTKTKLILPLKDIENVDKEIGFRFGYHGLVLVIRGYEELFFEFNKAENRDDCAVTLLQSLEAGKYMEDDSTILNPDEDSAALARDEHRLLQEARRSSTRADSDIDAPEVGETVYKHDEPAPVLFDDPRIDIINFKPPSSLRVTCLTIGSRGDVQPYIALCKGLLADGHQVRIATHREFQSWIEGHGIEFRPVEGDPAELMRICIENGMFTYSFLREASTKFRGWIDELMASAWSACQDSDLLIESPSAMCGIHIAEGLGIPYFRAFTMPWTRTRAYPHAFAVPNHKVGGAYNYYSYVMFDNVFWKAIAGQINRWRKKELGLRSTSLDKLQPNKVPFLYNFSPSVVPPPLDYSDWVQVTGYWFLDEATEWTPPPELVAFIDKARADKKKLVYIGFGSIVVSDPAGLTRTVCESVLKADVRCVLAKGWSDRLGDPSAVKTEVPLPPEIHQIKAAPHDWLFRQMDAAVHHGGAGTTGASLRAGIPTVCKPFFGDQFFFGSRVEDLGVGICLKKVNVSLLSRALWEAVNSERMIVKAKALGERIRKENGVQTAIRAIYRDLDYARTLVKTRADLQGQPVPQGDDEEEGEIEETWTFIGDESDADLQKKLQEMDVGRSGRGPRVSMDQLRSVQGVEPVRPEAREGQGRKSGVFSRASTGLSGK